MGNAGTSEINRLIFLLSFGGLVGYFGWLVGFVWVFLLVC